MVTSEGVGFGVVVVGTGLGGRGVEVTGPFGWGLVRGVVTLCGVGFGCRGWRGAC